MTIPVEQYTDAYFGFDPTYQHKGGYSNYHFMNHRAENSKFYNNPEDSTGTYFGDLIKYLNIKLTNRFIGKKVLVIGCAFGFEVAELRNLGVLADGVDAYANAVQKAEIYAPEAAPYITAGVDIRTHIDTYGRNEYDYIFSRWFLECMSDEDLLVLIPKMNFVCKFDQLHVINTNAPILWYKQRIAADYAAMDFNKTIIVENDDFDNLINV